MSPSASLDDLDSNVSTPLFGIIEGQVDTQGDPSTTSIYGQSAEETFVVDLEAVQSVTLSGKVTGFQAARVSGFSDDPLTALAEYCTQLLGYVNGNQGSGYRISHDYRGRSFDGAIESVTVTKNRAARFEADYSVSLKVGNPLMPQKDINPIPANPRDFVELGEYKFSEVDQLQIEQRQELETYAYTLHDPSDNEIMSKTGVVRTFTMLGNKVGPESERKNFDNAIENMIGNNQTISFKPHFPGGSFDVIPVQYDSKRKAGSTRKGEYRMKIQEGTVGT